MLKIEDLKKGEIYKYIYTGYFVIGECLESGTKIAKGIWGKTKQYSSFDRYSSNGNFHLSNSFENTTNEEKHWLNECIKADKFITYEEAMKTFKEKNENLAERYFKALEDNIQSSKTKKGEYYKIEKSSTSSLIEFNNKIHKTLLGISKTYFDKIEIMPEGWTPEQENKPQFEVGKWYKSKNLLYIAKLVKKSGIHTYPNTFPCEEYIYDNKYNTTENSHFTLNFMSNVEVSLSEIQQYLPDNHPDKIKEEWIPKVGDWVYIGRETNIWNSIVKLEKIERNKAYAFTKNNTFTYLDPKCIERKAFPNEIPQENSNFIPEYVECISEHSCFTVGKIYNFPKPFDDEGCQRNAIDNLNSGFGQIFKPSTKEAYLINLEKELITLL